MFTIITSFLGVLYHLYNQFSYMVLGQGISPVSFSVANVLKRVSVVVSSIVFFANERTGTGD
jgi:hypothetical protein